MILFSSVLAAQELAAVIAGILTGDRNNQARVGNSSLAGNVSFIIATDFQLRSLASSIAPPGTISRYRLDASPPASMDRILTLHGVAVLLEHRYGCRIQRIEEPRTIRFWDHGRTEEIMEELARYFGGVDPDGEPRLPGFIPFKNGFVVQTDIGPKHPRTGHLHGLSNPNSHQRTDDAHDGRFLLAVGRVLEQTIGVTLELL